MKWKIVKIIWGLFCLLIIVVMCLDLYDASNYPERYPFGGEGPVVELWWYKTQRHYILFSIILILWFFIGLVFCCVQHKISKLKWMILIHIFLTAVYIVFVNFVLSY
jgi:hypothetical protein